MYYSIVQFLVFVWQNVQKTWESAVLAKLNSSVFYLMIGNNKSLLLLLTIDDSTNHFHLGMVHYSKTDNHLNNLFSFGSLTYLGTFLPPCSTYIFKTEVERSGESTPIFSQLLEC